MSAIPSAVRPVSAPKPTRARVLFNYLKRDKFALAAAVFLAILVLAALAGPWLMGDAATKLGLRQRNLAPFSLDAGWLYWLGADTLGRPILPRLIVGASNTLGIAAAAVATSMLVGGLLGLVAGYSENWYSHVIQRAADIIMSFPSLLLALIVLYTLGPSVTNLVIVLAITRMPVYLRTARAEVLELRERMFVSAARAMGASSARILLRHIAPLVVPTLITISAIDFATVILAESALSFLGLGIQPPEFTWGAMVATGRGYLSTAWWIAFWPGLAIMLTTLSLNILSSWARTLADPQQRWRLQKLKKAAR
ncbi:ABC transporter permease [Bordetella petrii]|uniref:ABC transporter permease n=1 Tax=Bordetella petrii TaxID=94624 RepID=UPI001E5A9ECC|nr:ABC transporter permease [Bordetella petrii]MCD0504664.1 ABC transporter permease [Bordetella petrii]